MRRDNDLLRESTIRAEMAEQNAKRLRAWKLRWYRAFGILPFVLRANRCAGASHGNQNIVKFPHHRRQFGCARLASPPPTEIA